MNSFTEMLKSRKNVEFIRTYETCFNNCNFKECHFSVNDLLLQPFQRIVKYQLLLKELRKTRETNSTDELKLEIDKSLEQVTFTNCYLNEAKRDHEEIKRIRGIFRQFNLEPELDSGYLMREANEIKVVSFEKSKSVETIKTALLFESCLLILNRNKLDVVLEDYYDVYDKISLYDVKVKR